MNGRCSKKGQKIDKIPNNNINININFNVKEKNNFVGKKVENLVEISKTKGQKIEQQAFVEREELLQNKKKTTNHKVEDKLYEDKKKKQNIKGEQHTPQKLEKYREVREKSHTFLDKKRKSGKSVEVLRPVIYNSPSISNSRSKQGSHSRKKLSKTKNAKLMVNFQNSGIKKKIQDEHLKNYNKNNNKKPSSHKIDEQKFNNIRNYMNDKRKKQKKERQLSVKMDKLKIKKLKDQLKKVEEERKISASLKVIIPKGDNSRRKSHSTKRLPLFNLDDQNFDQETQYNRLRKQAQQLIYLEEDRQQKRKEKADNKSTIKKQQKFIDKYLKNQLTNRQQKYLTEAVTIIQKHWRGYKIRKDYANQLNLMNYKIQTLKNKVKLKNSHFWNSQSNSSIIKLGKRQQIQVQNNQQIVKQVEKHLELGDSQIISEIEQLKRTLQQQNLRYMKLQQENEKLKLNLQISLNNNESNEHNSRNESGTNQKQQSSLKNSIEVRSIEIENNMMTTLVTKRKQLAIETENVDNMKKMVQAYECSPRSDISASRIKDPNIIKLFHQKELKIQSKFNKKNQIFQKMLKDHLVSPRTYNLKVIDLKQAFNKQKQEIKLRMEQAKRVAQYIKSLQEEQLGQNKEKDFQSSQNEHPNNKWVDSLAELDQDIKSQDQKKQKNHNDQYIESDEDKEILNYDDVQQNQDSKLPTPKYEVKENEQLLKQIGQQHHSGLQNSQQPSQPQQQNVQSQKGFETNLTFIKDYCIALCEFIRANHVYKNNFMTNLANSITFDQFEFLKSYRTTLSNYNDTTYNSHRHQYFYPFFKSISPRDQAITRQVFDQFNQSYDRLTNRREIKIIQEYYLQCLFDAFNESVDYERPGSIYGTPSAWNSSSKYLKNHQNRISLVDDDVEQQKIDKLFGVSIARIIQWGSCLCGFIAQSLQLQKSQMIQFTQEQVQHVRQNRMVLMLQKAITEQENTMIDSELEQTEIRLQISEIIMATLIKQTISQLSQIFN